MSTSKGTHSLGGRKRRGGTVQRGEQVDYVRFEGEGGGDIIWSVGAPDRYRLPVGFGFVSYRLDRIERRDDGARVAVYVKEEA